MGPLRSTRKLYFGLIILGALPLAGCNFHAQPMDQTYAKNRCGGVPAGWPRFDAPPGELEPPSNKIELDANGIRWNNTKISRADLLKLETVASTMNPVPGGKLIVRGTANCGHVEFVRSALDRFQCSEIRRCKEFSDTEWARTLATEKALKSSPER